MHGDVVVIVLVYKTYLKNQAFGSSGSFLDVSFPAAIYMNLT